MNDKLHAYLKSKKFLFHGSSTAGITSLEPRQAFNFGKKDGPPAVHASQQLEPALFMAIIGSKKCGGMGKSDLPGFGFYLSKSDWKRANHEQWSGFVYIVNRLDFVQKDRWEWICPHETTVVDNVLVTINDLPKDITILTNEEYKFHLTQHTTTREILTDLSEPQGESHDRKSR